MGRQEPSADLAKAGVLPAARRGWDDAGMSQTPVNLSGGLPETVLPEPDPSVAAALDDALRGDGDERRQAAARVVAANPRYLAAWASLGDLGRDDIERYAY